MNNLRLFIAVAIDEPSLTTNLAKFQKLINLQGITLVTPELFHFSLHFLGDTAKEVLPDLQKIINTINQDKFTITLTGCGVFPSLNNIKVVWAGVQSGTNELISLQQQLSKPLEQLGFKLDTRPYSPHLTLGRVKFLKPENKKLLQRIISENKGVQFGSQTISTVHLMQSTLTPTGPIYQSLFHKDL